MNLGLLDSEASSPPNKPAASLLLKMTTDIIEYLRVTLALI